MSIYVGISDLTGDLVVGDMLVELTLSQEYMSESLAILDVDDRNIHPVPACIKILPDFPF